MGLLAPSLLWMDGCIHLTIFYPPTTNQQEKKLMKKVLSKTHRERIDEFNQYLSVLTEHNDIPRVSAAGNG